jgi:hypothetical protein
VEAGMYWLWSITVQDILKLKGIEKERVAEALFEFITRLCIPKEMPSDMENSLHLNVGSLFSINSKQQPILPSYNSSVEKLMGLPSK